MIKLELVVVVVFPIPKYIMVFTTCFSMSRDFSLTLQHSANPTRCDRPQYKGMSPLSVLLEGQGSMLVGLVVLSWGDRCFLRRPVPPFRGAF